MTYDLIKYIPLDDMTYDLIKYIPLGGLIIYISLIKLHKWIIYEIEIEVFNVFFVIS
jgi:hypothetical protein